MGMVSDLRDSKRPETESTTVGETSIQIRIKSCSMSAPSEEKRYFHSLTNHMKESQKLAPSFLANAFRDRSRSTRSFNGTWTGSRRTGVAHLPAARSAAGKATSSILVRAIRL